MDLLSPRTSRVGIPTGPKGVGVEIRAEFGPGMACVERLFPGNDEPRQQVMVFEPASGCPPPTHDVFAGPSRASPQGTRGPQTNHRERNVRRDRIPPRRQHVRGIHADDLIVRIEPSTTETMLKE